MTRIDKHREVRQLFEYRNRAQIESFARLGFIRSDSPLTENDSSVAFGRYIFGGKQKLLDGSAQSPLEHDRFVKLTNVREQLEVLHVARSDLQNIGVLTHDFQVPRIKNFGDDRQSG